MGDLSPYDHPIWGAHVSDKFMRRWRERQYVGESKPWARVKIRRGHMKRDYHQDWPGHDAPATVQGANAKQFGQIVGRGIHDLWYPNWTPTTDWIQLDGVYSIDLNQQVNFAGGTGGGNGICVASVVADNVAWEQVAGEFGDYHKKQRGTLWPWRGWVPTNRPGGSVEDRNQWYLKIPNAQILVEQGYGEDTKVKTFTGLIDTVGPGTIRPDRTTLVARDFGGMLVDEHPFMWNMDPRLAEPLYFVPSDYPKIAHLEKGKAHNWIIVDDATDIVRSFLRWSGFKEWEIEDAGVGLKTAYLVDRSKAFMDVINEVAAQLGYVFFIAEPTDDDLSIGVPVFRPQSVTREDVDRPIMLHSKIMTDMEPTIDNTNERRIIRVRGRPATRQQGGRPILGYDMNEDGQVLFTFSYWPPWTKRMAGVTKQLVYYNIGQNGVLGFGSNQECAVACVLIAIQIALTLDTATVQCPGNPAIGLDSLIFTKDEHATGVASRLYVTSRHTTWTKGGDGSSSSAPSNTGGGSDQLLWSTQLTGALVDNADWDALRVDYRRVTNGTPPIMHNPTGKDPEF